MAISRRLCAGPRAASRGTASSGLSYGARKRWRRAAFSSRTSLRSPGTRKPASLTIPGSSLSMRGTWDSGDSRDRCRESCAPVRRASRSSPSHLHVANPSPDRAARQAPLLQRYAAPAVHDRVRRSSLHEGVTHRAGEPAPGAGYLPYARGAQVDGVLGLPVAAPAHPHSGGRPHPGSCPVHRTRRHASPWGR